MQLENNILFIISVILPTVIIVSLVLFTSIRAYKRYRNFKIAFDISPRARKDWKMKSLVQEKIYKILEEKAQVVLDLCAEEDTLLKQSNLYTPRDTEIIDNEMVELKKIQKKIKKTKSDFWKAQKIANYFAFNVPKDIRNARNWRERYEKAQYEPELI